VNPLKIALNNVVADEAPRRMSVADTQFAIGAGGTSLPFSETAGVSITRAAPDAGIAPVDCSQAFVPFPGR
jgi:polygalacturonase